MICVIGLGFVGLTTALGFSEKGFHVTGYDIDTEKMGNLEKGVVPFHEPHLTEQLEKHKNSNFFLSASLADAVSKAEIIFYCVGTPSSDSGETNLTILKSAILDTLKYINKDSFKTLVIKSTVPPSTTKNFIKPLLESNGLRVGVDIGLANNPEFLREGLAWDDFINPDRIVIGSHDERSSAILAKYYEAFDAPVHVVSLNTGEFIKYLSNTLLSTLISFANEMSMVAHAIEDIDIAKSFKILHQDKRWSGTPAQMSSYVYPGCGFGGYCLPKDTSALYAIASKYGYTTEILQGVLTVNSKIKENLIERIKKAAAPGQPVGILGLSFKPGSDDVRDSPAATIIKMLIDSGYDQLIAYDPIAADNFDNLYRFPLQYASSSSSVLSQANVIVILTAWDEFKKIKTVSEKQIIVDGRYCLES